LLFGCQEPAVPVSVETTVASPYVRVIGASSEQGGKLEGWQDVGPMLSSGLATSDWLLVDFLNAGTVPQGGAVQLNDGGWLPGTPAPIVNDTPAWLPAGLPSVPPMPLDTLWIKSFGVDRHPQAFEDKDHLWVSTSSGGVDRQRGYLLEWQETGLLFETAAGEREFPWDRVLGLGLLAEQTPELSESVWIQLTNGSVVSARIVGLKDGVFDLLLPWQQQWSLPVTAVKRLRRRFDVTELATPSAWEIVEHPISEVLDWSPRFGKSVEGRPLRLGDGVYAQGVGVKVPTQLKHKVESPGLLMLTVGVDREVEFFRDPQPVVFEIRLDGKPLLVSEPRSFDDEPLVLRVAVPRAGNLTLVAKPDGVLPFGGHADFADLVWVAE